MQTTADVESRVVAQLETGRILEDLTQVLGRDAQTIRGLLEKETDAPGCVVASELTTRGIEPYVFSQALEDFYGQSDAFVFELIVWNRNRHRQAMLRWTGDELDREAKRIGRPMRVLTFGDGIGVDSATIALRGHQVTYYDFPGYTQRIAQRLFGRLGVDPKVVTDFKYLQPGQFDAITCFDVLEHVPQPKDLLVSLVGLLDSNGLMFVHAPFYMILPPYPTHLKCNRTFAGRLGLFERAGLQLIDGRWMWNPLMFRKSKDHFTPRSGRRLMLRIVGLALQTGRHTSFQFKLAHKLIRG